MAQYSEGLASRVRQALEERSLSTRDVAKLARGAISHMTVSEMVRGVVPSPRKIAAFAVAIGEHPDVYLEAAGEPFRYVGGLTAGSVMRGLAGSLAFGAR